VKMFYPIGTRTPAPPPGRPARSQSLYRLSYPGSLKYDIYMGTNQNEINSIFVSSSMYRYPPGSFGDETWGTTD
jgi:hypothetical protein